MKKLLLLVLIALMSISCNQNIAKIESAPKHVD